MTDIDCSHMCPKISVRVELFEPIEFLGRRDLIVLPLGRSLSFPGGSFVVKMEFLLGNPYSTPVGQCIGTLDLKLFFKGLLLPSPNVLSMWAIIYCLLVGSKVEIAS